MVDVPDVLVKLLPVIFGVLPVAEEAIPPDVPATISAARAPDESLNVTVKVAISPGAYLALSNLAVYVDAPPEHVTGTAFEVTTVPSLFE